MTLTPEQFPLRIPRVLVPWLPNMESFASAIKAATAAKVFSENACWMLAEGQELTFLLRNLEDYVVRKVKAECRDAGEYSAAEELYQQIALVGQYQLYGWQEGRCVPWGIAHQYPSKPYRVHLARLVRDDIEPYRLLAHTPICNVQVKGVSKIHYGREPNCGTCRIFVQRDPELYPTVIEVKEFTCPTL